MIFFADEGGSWQVGVQWAKVLPAWFACLARTADPDLYARRVIEVIDEFDRPSRWQRVSEAERVGTPEQRRALQRATGTSDR